HSFPTRRSSDLSNLIDLDDLIPPYLRYYRLEMLPQDHTTNLIFNIATDGDIEFIVPDSLKGWGRDDYGQVSDIPDGLKAKVVGGIFHNIVITTEGDGVAWGRENYGQVSGVADGVKA